jgi:LysM repeat protein
MEHTVRHGETLTSISHRYGVTVTAIMQANRLHSYLIHPGQRLYIPVHHVQYQQPHQQPHPTNRLDQHEQQLSSHDQRITNLEQRLNQNQ